MPRAVIVTIGGEALTFPDVLRVARSPESRLELYHQGERGEELLAEFAAPPQGWQAWRWAPLKPQTRYEGNMPGQILIEVDGRSQPIKPYQPPP
jgi:hypothetical protein